MPHVDLTLSRSPGNAADQIGPLTTLSEAAATAVGAGVILGSVAVGVCGVFLGSPKRQIESLALFGGYLGGAAGGFFALVDAILRYG